MLTKLFKWLASLLIKLWMILALIPLLLGIIMVDVVMKKAGVEKHMLLWTTFALWVDRTNKYLDQIINQEKQNNV